MKIIIAFAILHLFSVASAEIDLQNLEVPDVDIDDFAVVKEKCDKVGGEGTYEKLKSSKDAIQNCVKDFANVTAVEDEVEEAKKTGSMDEVFAKYCAKRGTLSTCIQNNFVKNLRLCLNDEENKALNTTLDALKQLGDFACYRDGDRIAMFVAEGGVECIKNHVEGIKNCVNTTFKIQPNTVNTNSLPTLLIDKKKCNDLGKLQSCVVEELEKCSESTPANIIDALFKFIKRTACTNKNKRSVQLHRMVKRSVSFANSFFYDSQEMKNNVLKVFKEKCSQNFPDGGYEAFTLTMESAAHCIRNKTKNEPIFVTNAQVFKENINRCVRKLIEKTEACLPEEEKYWPEFYLEIINNVVDFFYENKHTLMKISRVEVINCFQTFKQINARKELFKCFEAPEINSLKKDVVCGKMTNMNSCVTETVQKKCIRDVTINKLTEDFFKTVTAPCKDA